MAQQMQAELEQRDDRISELLRRYETQRTTSQVRLYWSLGLIFPILLVLCDGMLNQTEFSCVLDGGHPSIVKSKVVLGGTEHVTALSVS